MNNQEKAPFFEALSQYIDSNHVSFHTPGHKSGAGISSEFLSLVGETTFQLDLCELPELDNLHQAEHVLKESQSLAAELFGADFSFFLVNGSTCGNQAMIMSVCQPGDKILIPRNVHKSVMGGLVLSGAIPVYIEPVWDPDLGLFQSLSAQGVEEAFALHSNIKALLLVSPTYEGIASDIKSMAAICHRHKVPLLVDEAHGPHLRFHDGLPLSALEAGADMVVQSTHKITSSLTQSALLHIQGEWVNSFHVQQTLQLLQSTSPSCLLMASLDVARRQMALQGEGLLTHALEISGWARLEINQIPGLSCMGKEILALPGFFDMDLTKLMINVSGLGLTGFECESILHEKYKIQSEMATPSHLLQIVTFGNSKKDMGRLMDALKEIKDGYKGSISSRKTFPVPELPEMVLSPRDAFNRPSKAIAFSASIGEISAEAVSPYPPGIPLLVPGERISQSLVDYLSEIVSCDGFVSGVQDRTLNTIQVVDFD